MLYRTKAISCENIRIYKHTQVTMCTIGLTILQVNSVHSELHTRAEQWNVQAQNNFNQRR